MSATPRISVVLIFKDAAGFLGDAVASVRAQTLVDWELLLVDDGSVDGSSALAAGLVAGDPRIRYLEHPDHANLGMSASRNAGIDAARAPLVCFLDADDLYLPRRLELHVEALEGDPTIDAVQSLDLLQRADDLDPSAPLPVIQPRVLRDGLVVDPPDLLIANLACPALKIGICSITVRRRAALGPGGFEPAFRGLYEDRVLLTKVFLKHRVRNIDEPLATVRLRAGSSTHAAFREAHREDGPWRSAARRFLEWQIAYLRERDVADPMLADEVDGLVRRLARLPLEGLHMFLRGHAIELLRALLPAAALARTMQRQRDRVDRAAGERLLALERTARDSGRSWSIESDVADGRRPP